MKKIVMILALSIFLLPTFGVQETFNFRGITFDSTREEIIKKETVNNTMIRNSSSSLLAFTMDNLGSSILSTYCSFYSLEKEKIKIMGYTSANFMTSTICPFKYLEADFYTFQKELTKKYGTPIVKEMITPFKSTCVFDTLSAQLDFKEVCILTSWKLPQVEIYLRLGSLNGSSPVVLTLQYAPPKKGTPEKDMEGVL